MRKVLGLIVFCCVLCVGQANAQLFYTSMEYGVSGGGSEYFGDLNENYGFRYVRPAGGGFIRYNVSPYIALKGGLNLTHVGYDDKYSNDPYDQKRNLNFQSNIAELVAQAEFNFFRFSTGEDGSRFTPYLTGGIGIFYYNPYTYLNGTKYNLREQGTEGQNAGYTHRKYSSFSVCFPIGVGVKYWIKPGYNIGFEIADRLTTTDYLDDVSTTYVGINNFPTNPNNPNAAAVLQDRSAENGGEPLGRPGKQRGNSASKDQYLMFMINFSFQLRTYRCPGYKSRESDYPRF